MSLYSHLFKPVLFQLDPERAHDLALAGLRAGGRTPSLLTATFGPPPCFEREVGGVQFRNPVGLAAGMDKNAIALPAWEALGFGFIEVGTITAHPQPGNPTPRLFRYPELGALVNRFGFNNDGSTAVAARLEHLRDSGRWPRIPVGVNIGKSKVTELADAAADYRESFTKLQTFGDYFVVNVSSPNTPGLRDLQHVDALRSIMDTLRSVDSRKPIFVKIAPDLAAADLDPLVDIPGISGFVATNTSLDHSALPPDRDETGGLSGTPITKRAHEILLALRARTRLPIIASGGITSGEDGSDRLEAGANLVQIYTGFVYKGPGLIRDICNSAQKSG
ncbi:MAG: quinone-dependent dihydroorotate dehydrogenase [Chthoniobacterales bacterium]